MHLTELPGDLPMPLECHTLTLNMIALQLSDSRIAPTHFRIPLTSVHFEADNATHALASSTTAKLKFNDEDEVICNGWTPEEEYFLARVSCMLLSIFYLCVLFVGHCL